LDAPGLGPTARATTASRRPSGCSATWPRPACSASAALMPSSARPGSTRPRV